MQILVMSCQDPAIKQGRENPMKIDENTMIKQMLHSYIHRWTTITQRSQTLTNDWRFAGTMLHWRPKAAHES